jgi:membrane protein DedA with SNARE-associated domain
VWIGETQLKEKCMDNRRLKMDRYGNRIVFIIKFVMLVGFVMEYLRDMRTGEI